MLHNRRSGKTVLCSLSVGNVFLFVILMLLCVIIVVKSSMVLMASKKFRCLLDEFMTEFVFFFQTDVEGALCGESVVDNRGDGYVFDATIVSRFLVITVIDFKISVDGDVVFFSHF